LHGRFVEARHGRDDCLLREICEDGVDERPGSGRVISHARTEANAGHGGQSHRESHDAPVCANTVSGTSDAHKLPQQPSAIIAEA
jgi:hypothetical protein